MKTGQFYKRSILAAALVLWAGTVIPAQTPCDRVDLCDMTFVRQSFQRNFYNSGKVFSCINMDGTDLFLDNAANLMVSGDNVSAIKQEGRRLVFNSDMAGRTTVRVGAFHPYLCYEADFADVHAISGVGISFTENEGDGIIEVLYSGGAITASRNGKELARKLVEASDKVSLRVQYTGQRFHVFFLHDDGRADLVMSVQADMRSCETPIRWSWNVFTSLKAKSSVTLLKARSLLSCGTGQADPQVVQHKDGSPYIKDGKLYVCFTTRGFEKIPDSYQGVYSLDISSFELKLEGALLFGDNDGLMHGYHATKVVWDDDRERFLVMTTTHGGSHTLAWCETDSDILHGISYLECTELVFPHSAAVNPKFNTEDPDFFFDAKSGRWRLAYCAMQDGSYVTFLCESRTWNGTYTQIARSGKNNNTGIRITSVGGKRYVLSGGPDTTFYIYDYPSLEYLGTFNQQYANGGFRGWPTIVPLPCGNYEKYLWITFDRGALTGRYSYGTLYFYIGDKMWRK